MSTHLCPLCGQSHTVLFDPQASVAAVNARLDSFVAFDLPPLVSAIDALTARVAALEAAPVPEPVPDPPPAPDPDPEPPVYPTPKGPLVVKSGETYRDCFIDGGTGNAAVKNAPGAAGVLFERCRFRGGGGSLYNGCDVIMLQTSASGWQFIDCEVECNLGTEVSGHTKHFDNVYIQPAVTGATIKDILFKRTHFGVDNGVRSGSPRFNVELYAVNSGTRNSGFSGIDFEDCIFEAADDENLDYSGSVLSADPSKPNNGPCHVTGCTFKGNGAKYVWYGDLIIEAGAGLIEVARNTFQRGAGDAIVIGGNGGTAVTTACNVHDNVIDGDSGIAHNAFEYVAIMSRGNFITGNRIVNANPGRRTVSVSGNNNTVTGNVLVGGPLWNGGSGNVVTPNTVN